MLRDSARATAAPPVLLAVAIVLAVVAGGVALRTVPTAPSVAAVALSVSGPQFALTHRGGAPLDARDLRLRVTVDGTPLARQPPVPFFAATGFRSGPSGPFNAAADPRWTPGETARFTIASTNRPIPGAGSEVVVAVYVDGQLVTEVRATA